MVTSDGVRVSKQINNMLVDITELAVEKFIVSWYSAYTDNDDFIIEIRLMMKEFIGRLIRRLRNVDYAMLVQRSLAPALLTHIELYLNAKKLHDHELEACGKKSSAIMITPHERALRIYCNQHHAALHSEQRYFRGLFQIVFNLLLPADTANCPSVVCYFVETMSSGLRPMLHKMAAPAMLNGIFFLKHSLLPVASLCF